MPPDENPTTPDAGLKIPVDVSPTKVMEGAPALPGLTVTEVIADAAAEPALNTFVPSQTTVNVWFCGSTTVAPPTAAVLKVRLNDPDVVLFR